MFALALLVVFVVFAVLSEPLPRRRGRPPAWVRRARAFRARLLCALVHVLALLAFAAALVGVVVLFAFAPPAVLAPLAGVGGALCTLALWVFLR